MPKVDMKAFSAQLVERGMGIRLLNGQYTIVERSNSFVGLPRKLRAVKVHIGKKPEKGSPGRKKGGYNLQGELQMSNADYRLIYGDAKVILERTHGIDTNLALSKQDDGAVDLAVRKFVAVHTEFKGFGVHGYWAPRALFQMILRVKSGKANSTANEQEGDGSAGKPSKKRKAKAVEAPAHADVNGAQPGPNDQPVAASNPALKALQGENEDDHGEFFDLNLPDDFDTTMRSAVIDFNNMSVDVGYMPGNNNDEDNDNAAFDMAQVLGPAALAAAP
ncbi:hypothetical protein BDV93DRAFT_565905, partial [Ceratobasidium sp. AG-I]